MVFGNLGIGIRLGRSSYRLASGIQEWFHSRDNLLPAIELFITIKFVIAECASLKFNARFM